MNNKLNNFDEIGIKAVMHFENIAFYSSIVIVHSLCDSKPKVYILLKIFEESLCLSS